MWCTMRGVGEPSPSLIATCKVIMINFQQMAVKGLGKGCLFSFTQSHGELTRLVTNKKSSLVRRKAGVKVGNECLVDKEISVT